MFIVLSIYKQLLLWDRTDGFVVGVRKNYSNSHDDETARFLVAKKNTAVPMKPLVSPMQVPLDSSH